MIKTALAKLSNEQMLYCKALSFNICRARAKGLEATYENTKGKLRGFLECLYQMKVISISERMALYHWFFTEDRS